MTLEPRKHPGAVATEPFEDLVDVSAAMVAADGMVRLLGSRCLECDAKAFPRRTVCFACRSVDLEEWPLGPYGVLYTYTVVHVAPELRTPYCVGYVDLDEGVRVLAMIVGANESRGINARGRLVAGPDGDWAFRVDDLHFAEGEAR
jgi:uncharacterized protein